MIIGIDYGAVFMNNPAADIVEGSVDIRFNSAEYVHSEYGTASTWLTRPFTAITHVLSGTSRIAFDMDPATAIERNAGATTYISAGAWRKSEVLSAEGASFVWVRASFSLFGGLDLMSFFKVPLVFPPKTGSAFKSILGQIVRLEEDGKLSLLEKAVFRKMLLYKLLALVIENSEPREGDAHELLMLVQRLRPAITYVNSHYDKSIAVDELALMCSVSGSRFHRLFHKAFNVSPLEYQIRLRMKEAQKLLLFSDLNIAEIAVKTGYADQFHFSRTFKSRCGESPLKYRTNSEKFKYTL